MKLKLYKDFDQVTILCFDLRKGDHFHEITYGFSVLGYATEREIGLNRDQITHRKNLLVFPQTVIHEMLHYLFIKHVEIHKIIHRIHRFSRRLIL